MKTVKYRVFWLTIIIAVVVFIILAGVSNIKQSEIILTQKEKQWLEENGPLVYAADRNAPPLRFQDAADNQYKGILIDYVNSLSVEIGANIELYPLVWQDVLTSLEVGDSDFSDMFSSNERAKKYLFTEPIYNLRAVLVVDEKDITTKNLEDLRERKMAIQKGDFASEFLTANYPDIEQVYVSDLQEALTMLANGDVDATLGDEPVVFHQMDNLELEETVRVVEEPIYENQVVFAVNKDKPELVPILNKGIKALETKSVLEKIQQKWFGISTPIVTQVDIEELKNIAFAVIMLTLMVFGGMILWNNSLKKQISIRTSELLDSRDELQKVFDGMSEFMLVIDADGKIININSSFLSYIRKEKEKLLGKYYIESIPFTKEIKLSDQVEETFELKKKIIQEKDYRNRVFEIKTYPLSVSLVEEDRVLVLMYDITSNKLSENRILQANKMVAIGELAAGIAHEIRNPLGLIRNQSFILRGICHDEIQLKSLDYIDKSIKRASKIIENILNFSRISGEGEEKINIYGFLNDVIDLQEKSLENRNIELSIEVPKDISLTTNLESMKHIFINLISNSMDAMNDGGKLILKSSKIDQGVLIEVSDTGIGIEKEDIERIFNPFYTTKDPGVGTGLGLYIAYNEIEKLNGSIEVESEKGQGTTFKVQIPEGGNNNG
jgi:polar amino acid transport system substrate-binding protein